MTLISTLVNEDTRDRKKRPRLRLDAEKPKYRNIAHKHNIDKPNTNRYVPKNHKPKSIPRLKLKNTFEIEKFF